jgi:hypothetical protein
MVWQHTVALTQGSVMHITHARDVVAAKRRVLERVGSLWKEHST